MMLLHLETNQEQREIKLNVYQSAELLSNIFKSSCFTARANSVIINPQREKIKLLFPRSIITPLEMISTLIAVTSLRSLCKRLAEAD